MKCKICNEKITSKRYKYCPICAAKLVKGGDFRDVQMNRMKYLWERLSQGKFVYSNFEAFRNIGVHPYRSRGKPFRHSLGDFSHVGLYTMRIVSMVYAKPEVVFDLFRMGKFFGHMSYYIALTTTGLDKVINVLNRTNLFWKVFENKQLQKAIYIGWRKNNGGVLDLVKVTKKRKIRYRVGEIPMLTIGSPKPIGLEEIGAAVGGAETLFGGYWNITELQYSPDDHYCEFELTLDKEEKPPPIKVAEKDEVAAVLDNLIKKSIIKKERLRKDMEDTLHISVDQFFNYLLIATSPGHEILSKHSGRICGERIIEKTNISDIEEIQEYIKELFLYLKAGILNWNEKGGQLNAEMQESVYSSGVNNIGMKLDTFLAGMVEGALCQATGEKWRVEETKCLANGDDYCQFTCKKQT